MIFNVYVYTQNCYWPKYIQILNLLADFSGEKNLDMCDIKITQHLGCVKRWSVGKQNILDLPGLLIFYCLTLATNPDTCITL